MTGNPGYNTAQVILQDLGLGQSSKPERVGGAGQENGGLAKHLYGDCASICNIAKNYRMRRNGYSNRERKRAEPRNTEGMLVGQNVGIEGNRIARVQAGRLPGPDTKQHLWFGCSADPGTDQRPRPFARELSKARIEAVPLEFWLFDLFGSSFAFTERENYLAAMIGAIEMLKTGTHGGRSFLGERGDEREALDAVMSAYRDIGIRAGVAPLVEDDHKINEMILAQNPELKGGVYGSSPPIDAAEYIRVLERFSESGMARKMAAFNAWPDRRVPSGVPRS